MTIVLTGDVHQWIDSADRSHATETESALAVEYARMASRHGLKVTLFFTGLAILEDARSLRALLQEDNVEIGGHGWDSFRPVWRYRLWSRLFGSPHGSASMQARMIRRTCASIEHATGQRVLSWRNHAYAFDTHTPVLLERAGVRAWSDEVDRSRTGPYRHTSGIVSLPINTTPDHEHMYHGGQTPETISPVRQERYERPIAWRERVVREAQSIVESGGVATILAHPLCMTVADNWDTFEYLCSRLAGYRSAWAMEAAQRANDPNS